MCGICGLLSQSGFTPDGARHAVAPMAASLAHRGPDEGNLWNDSTAPVAFGHRRLAIIDPSPAGAQPMSSHCGRYVLATNGEIYNHTGLRERLALSGVAPNWNGHSDTETMLACFSAWGVEKALRAFEGMFAFALWDRKDRVLTLARDRMGEKPLYYGWQGGDFLFASELKALRAFEKFDAIVDRSALSLYLRHACVPAPYSIYSGIRKLRPGHFLKLDWASVAARREPEPQPYWQLTEAIEAGKTMPFHGSDFEAVEELDRILSASVSRQMMSDVPLGAFLSGGIDSSLVVSLMQAQTGRPVKTFTIGTQDADIDEAKFASDVAGHLGTDHTELYVSDADGRDLVPKLSEIYCEPFADSSQIPTFLVSELARRDVTVALSGDGGDELFGGYNRYLTARRVWEAVQKLPEVARNAFRRLLLLLPPRLWDRLFAVLKPVLPQRMRMMSFGDKTAKLAQALRFTENDAFFRDVVSHWKDPSSVVLGGSEPKTLLDDTENHPAFGEFEHWMMAMDAVTYMPDDIFTKVDRASMANSLEVRVPLVSPPVVDFAWSLPLEMKIRDGSGKWLMRQVLGKYVPNHLIDRPKAGFGIPLGAWLRGPLRDWAEDLLAEKRLSAEGYFDPAPIRSKWRQHIKGTRNWQHDLWDILMFQSWHEGQAHA